MAAPVVAVAGSRRLPPGGPEQVAKVAGGDWRPCGRSGIWSGAWRWVANACFWF